MSRILICVGGFEPSLIYGGQAAAAADHAYGLAERGHDVSVLTTNLISLKPVQRHALTTVEQRGVRIHYLHALVPYPHFSAVIVPGLRAWLRRELPSFDLMHIHFPREFLSIGAAAAAREMRKPYVVQTHGTLHRTELQHRLVDRLFVRKALHGAAAVLALQQEEERQLKAIAPDARVERIANGIPMPEGSPQWSPERLRGVPKLVFLARLAPVKGVLDLVEAAALLKTRGVHARYEIVGPDGGDLAAAQERVRALGLADAFEFAGAVPRDEALRRLAGAAIHVQPSHWECFSLTTLEALSVGTPCIVTKGNELWQELRAAGAALVVEPGAASFADGIAQVLRDAALASSLSQQGHQWVRENCSLPAVIDRLEEIYRTATATVPRGSSAAHR